ncbi:MAG: hypothetical protein AAF944_07480 [Bacteroidota bacterium]
MGSESEQVPKATSDFLSFQYARSIRMQVMARHGDHSSGTND